MSIDAESLRTFAEVAAGLVGFAAVSTGLAANRTEGLTAFDKVRFYWIVAGGLAIIFMSYIPVWLRTLGTDVSDVWFNSTLVSLVVIILCLPLVFGPLINEGRVRLELLGVHAGGWMVRINAISAVLAICIVLNLLSWPIEANQATFEFMIMVGLAQMAYNFVSLVVVRDTEAGT